jgi:hypothetical protein
VSERPSKTTGTGTSIATASPDARGKPADHDEAPHARHHRTCARVRRAAFAQSSASPTTLSGRIDAVKITIKVSHNLHASVTPFLLGALVGRKGDAATGFEQIRTFLETTGADVSGASQSDGAGADAHFTPDFVVHYLAYMAKQPSAAIFHDALPILGKDGTLWKIQVKSPAAGHVYAKTGTSSAGDLLHKGLIVTGKGLAGYMTTADGQHLAFAIYANNVLVKEPCLVTPLVGEALGGIAAAAHNGKPDRRGKSE